VRAAVERLRAGPDAGDDNCWKPCRDLLHQLMDVISHRRRRELASPRERRTEPDACDLHSVTTTLPLAHLQALGEVAPALATARFEHLSLQGGPDGAVRTGWILKKALSALLMQGAKRTIGTRYYRASECVRWLPRSKYCRPRQCPKRQEAAGLAVQLLGTSELMYKKWLCMLRTAAVAGGTAHHGRRPVHLPS